MKKIFLAIAAAAMIFSTTSCADKLDIAQHGVTGIEDFYKTDTDANEAISTIYYLWQTMYGGATFFYVLNLPSDDMYAGGKARGAYTAIEDLSDYTLDESNAKILDTFTYLYQIVYRANAIIQYMPDPDTDVKKEVVAEAYFFRAWAYFYLTAFWGTPPIADHVLNSDEYLQPNATQAELYALMESDLNKALSLNSLPEKKDANSQVVRITKQAAQAMLGKVYVWEKKWSDAQTMLENVINSGKYELYYGDYGEIMNSTTDFCCENILETNVVRDDSNRMTSTVYVGIGWRGELFDWTGNDLDVNTIGWGQANPTKELYDAFVADEGVDGYRLNRTILTYKQLTEHGISLKPGRSFEQNAGLFSYKFRYSKTGLNGSVYTAQTNTRYMRYAEVLLLAAEAAFNNGHPDAAKDYVNEIRKRARLEPLTSVTMDNIKTEKRLELCYEGTRYLDIQRWGDAATVCAEKGKTIPAVYSDGTVNMKAFTYTTGGYKTGKHEYFPFPTKEMDVNTKLTQNPGWGD